MGYSRDERGPRNEGWDDDKWLTVSKNVVFVKTWNVWVRSLDNSFSFTFPFLRPFVALPLCTRDRASLILHRISLVSRHVALPPVPVNLTSYRAVTGCATIASVSRLSRWKASRPNWKYIFTLGHMYIYSVAQNVI